MATQLSQRIQNSSTDAMMKAPQQLSMEELEAIGEKYVKTKNLQQKNILASVRYIGNDSYVVFWLRQELKEC